MSQTFALCDGLFQCFDSVYSWSKHRDNDNKTGTCPEGTKTMHHAGLDAHSRPITDHDRLHLAGHWRCSSDD